MTVEDIEKMNYSQFVGLIKERNRPSGGIKTVHTVAVNAFIDNSKRMLEIGSNTGFTSVNMSLLTGCEVVGIDSNEPSINEAKSYAEALGVHDVDFVPADALNLPFEDASFDVVWSSNVTSFIGDKDKAISEYMRVLKPGGILVVVPIYYRAEPPTNIVKDVSEAIGTEIKVWDKEFWEATFSEAASSNGQYIEKIYDADFKYRDRQKELPAYIDMLLQKEHLQQLRQEEQIAVRKQCEHFMTLFNKNLQYAGFSILLYQKRTQAEEIELFLSEKVQ